MKRITLLASLFIVNLALADFPDLKDEDLVPCTDGIYDLECEYSPFVIETKKIEIEEYPQAFNPSIVSWNDKLLLSFRIRDENSVHNVGLAFVDENLNLISPPKVLHVESCPTFCQDPRLIMIQGRLHMVYSALYIEGAEKGIRRVHIGEILEENEEFFLKNPEPLLFFDKESKKRVEKNWVPFNYDDELLLSYSITPHHVYKPIPEDHQCETLYHTETEINWDFGELRGGSQAIKEEGFYLSFFHSSKKLASFQSDNKMMIHYFLGAYTFEDHPPFALKAYSPVPILGKNFYTKTDFKTWKPLKVVFSNGFISGKDHLWLVYGKQDSEMWAAKIDKKGLLNSLVPIN